MSNAGTKRVKDAASPLAEEERIEVRGFPMRYREFTRTLTLSSPFQRERRKDREDMRES